MNRRKKVALIWLVISLVSFIVMTLPFIFENSIDMNQGGGAMIMVGLLMGITSLIVFIMYWKMGQREAHITDDIGSQIVTWNYSDDEWQNFAQYQYKERIKDNKGIWMMIAGISIVCIIPITLIIQDIVFAIGVVVVLLAFLSIFIVLPPLAQRSRILHSPKTAIISDNGVQIGKELALFDFKISWLDSIDIDDSYLLFHYSAFASPTIVQSYNFRVPIKSGSEGDVDKIIEFYSTLEKPAKINDSRNDGATNHEPEIDQ